MAIADFILQVASILIYLLPSNCLEHVNCLEYVTDIFPEMS